MFRKVIVALAAFTIFLFVTPGTSSAFLNGTTRFAAVVISPGAGYDTGAGVKLDHITDKYKNIVSLHGLALLCRRYKTGATDGYTYSFTGAARFHLTRHQQFFAGAGVTHAGYRSEFSSGAVWEKSMWQPVLFVGYDHDPCELALSYHLRENDTPNRVSATSLDSTIKVWRDLFIYFNVQDLRYDQPGRTGRQQDTLTRIGLGWEWD